MSTKEINLVFLTSLGEQWESFHQSNAHRAYNIKTAELFAEVTTIDDSKTSKDSDSAVPQAPRYALYSKFNSENHRGKKRNKSLRLLSKARASYQGLFQEALEG